MGISPIFTSRDFIIILSCYKENNDGLGGYHMNKLPGLLGCDMYIPRQEAA
jgi:hypothetical protein